MTPDPVPRADVLFYVQHLLGIGHVQRAAIIARALGRAGLKVVLVTGGPPVPGLDAGAAHVVQLPPLRTRDETFSELVDLDGRPIDDAWKAARAEHLCAVYRAAAPRVLMTEMFPFGRRQLRFELLPLLEAARAATPRPHIVCSLRDVLTDPSKPGKAQWMVDTFGRLFDLVLVHGDPDVLPLARSFPMAAGFADKIRYTGYVVREPTPIGTPGNGDEVVVSTGGGAVGARLIQAALAARGDTPLANDIWRILIGHGLPESAYGDLVRTAPTGVVVERARPDFPALLARARLSISQAGYNTVLEVLAAGVPAVVVPFAAGGETEQSLRARVFAAHGLLTVVEEAQLSGPRLAAAVVEALAPAAGTRGALALRTDGATETARLVADLAAIVAP